jgi:hypothetical protein
MSLETPFQLKHTNGQHAILRHFASPLTALLQSVVPDYRIPTRNRA